MKQKIYLTLVACLLCFSQAQAQTERNINAGSVTIETSGTHTITGNGAVTTNTIAIASDVVATITLKNVNIESSACAFDISSGANITLVLSEINTLKSGRDVADLQVNEGAMLIIEAESKAVHLPFTAATAVPASAGAGITMAVLSPSPVTRSTPQAGS